MFVVCCVGSGLCDGLITRPEESCWVWCVCLVVCDLGTSMIRWSRPELGRWNTEKKKKTCKCMGSYELGYEIVLSKNGAQLHIRILRILRRVPQNFGKLLLASSRPSVLTEHFVSHWTDFREIWYWSTSLKTVKEIQVSLKSDRNKGYFT